MPYKRTIRHYQLKDELRASQRPGYDRHSKKMRETQEADFMATTFIDVTDKSHMSAKGVYSWPSNFLPNRPSDRPIRTL